MARPVRLLTQHPPAGVAARGRPAGPCGMRMRGRFAPRAGRLLAVLPVLALLAVLAALAGGARAQPSAEACARPPDQLTAVICAVPELMAASVANARAYSALRQQLGKPGEAALAQAAAAAQAGMMKDCRIDVHAVAPEPGSPAWSARRDCMLAAFRAQHAAWMGQLEGAAKEEAGRGSAGLEQGQRDLRALGFLGARVAADGVYRPSTRAAILAWQAQAGLPASGVLGDADTAALHAAATAPAPGLPVPGVAAPGLPAAMPPPVVTASPGDGMILIRPPAMDPVAGPPMRFIPDETVIPVAGPGPRRVIYAEGTITTGSPDELARLLAAAWPAGSVVVLASQGGNAMAGLRMGRMIRKAGLATVVGRRGADGQVDFATARCFSACADMFLGGVERFHAPGSQLGVHRFRFAVPVPEERGEAAVRAMRSIMQVYVRDMGVDEAYLDEATRAESRHINVLNPARMAALRVTTGGAADGAAVGANGGRVSAWEVGTLGGRRVLSTHVSDRDGTQMAAFACPERPGAPALLMVGLRATRPDLTEAAARWPVRMEADKVPVLVAGNDVAVAPRMAGETLVFGLRLGPRLLEAVGRAERLSIRRTSPDGGAGLGLEVEIGPAARQLAGFLAGCQ